MGRSIGSPAFALDEELWFGEGTDVEAESRAAASLAAVGARIVGAKPFPLAARRLDELTRNTNTRIEQVVTVLESDPALSARLLRLVNSAGYGLKIRCTSVRHAAVLVGTRRLNQVATTAAILDLFDGNNERAMELLEHAAIVGSLCRYLAVHVGLPHDEMFTCGFLHDIGKLMLLDAERERYADVLAQYAGAPDQIHVEERRIFGFDHAVLGAHVLAAWNIPDPVPKVIAWHHSPARAMQDTVLAAMVSTLRLADLLSYVLALHDKQVGIEVVSSSESARYLDISDVQLSAMWDDLTGLRERSRARSHGEPELEVMVPKSDVPESLRPRSQRVSRTTASPNSVSRASRPLQEVPTHFPCSVCGKQSYGNLCLACGGHVCPEHQGPSDEWCTTCRREFGIFRKTAELSLWVKVGVGLLVGGTLAVGVVSAARSPHPGVLNWVVGPVVVMALWAVVLPVAYQLWQKLRFLQGRRQMALHGGMPASRASLPMTAEEEGVANVLNLSDPPSDGDSGPELQIGPISTASIALSVAPRSSVPLSMAPVSVPPSSSMRVSNSLGPARDVPAVDPVNRGVSRSPAPAASVMPVSSSRDPRASLAPVRSLSPDTLASGAAEESPRAESSVAVRPATVSVSPKVSSPPEPEQVPTPLPPSEPSSPSEPSTPATVPSIVPAPPVAVADPLPARSLAPLASIAPASVVAAATPSLFAAQAAPSLAPKSSLTETGEDSDLPSESGSHVVLSKRAPRMVETNTALRAESTVRCSPASFNACVSGAVVLMQPPPSLRPVDPNAVTG